MIDDRPLAPDQHVRERMTEVSVERRGLGYFAFFPHASISLEFDQLRRRSGELYAMVSVHVPDYPGTLHMATLNLASTTSRATLARALTERMDGRFPTVPWREVVDRPSMVILEAERQGPPEERIGQLPIRLGPAFRLEPILPLGHPTTIYGESDTGKSYLALALAMSVETGVEIIPGFRPLIAPTLYLDWETDAQSMDERAKQIAAGAGIDPPEIRYMPCRAPLVELTEQIARIVARDAIGLIVLDSMGLAAGQGHDGGDANETTLRLFSALREIATTSLIVDHIPKSDAANPSRPARPYGSTYKMAMVRQGFELRSTSRLGEPTVSHLGLYHAKHNLMAALPAIGVLMRHEPGIVAFQREEIIEELTASLSVPERAARVLRDGPMAPAELAERIAADPDTLRRQLNRAKARFTRLPDNRWALLEGRLDAQIH